MRALLLLAIIAAFLVAAPAEATCEMTTSTPEVDTGDHGPDLPRYYVDNDVIQTAGPIFSIWVYEESNGLDGLQRGDEVVDDTCGGAAGPGDTVII
ncbi:MAG TPA: hypothetical protein VM370_12505 [Candidatus Thermoplasmatota archaeon]|nr:hypothetical protein [Candidatus Thermoplasmatota archaeon]